MNMAWMCITAHSSIPSGAPRAWRDFFVFGVCACYAAAWLLIIFFLVSV